MYPQHEKLKARSTEHEAIAEFLEFLEFKNYAIGFWDGNWEGYTLPKFTTVKFPKLLAEFFDIDQTAFEKEENQMLEDIRRRNEPAATAPTPASGNPSLSNLPS